MNAIARLPPARVTALRTPRPVRRALLGAAVLVLGGCDTIGTIGSRSEAVNRTTASYAAAAVLFNILRATHAEPLNFVSLTGVTGHTTATVSLGLPTIALGPDRTPAERVFLFGPNTIGGSEANDFVVNVVDDPASYAALSRPVDPATIGFFVNQYSTPDILFFLFISKLQILDSRRNIVAEHDNEPYVYADGRFGLWQQYKPGFFSVMRGYLDRGLTVAVDQGFVPAGGKSAAATFCFVPRDPDTGVAIHRGMGAVGACKPPQPAAAAAAKATPAATTRTGARHATMPSPAATDAAPNWEFDDPDQSNPGGKVHLYSRSVFGMYRFLGEVLNLRENGQLEALGDPQGIFAGSPLREMIYVTHDGSECWTSVRYEGKPWCVPNNAIGTKRVFALLHQLFELYAAPNNQPATQTVRTTP